MDAAPVWPNLKTFPCRQFHGLVDVLIAGYPCQPFSYAGKRSGEEDPRHLWPYIRRAVELIRPGGCLFENVAGHLTLGFKNVVHDLDELGYRVTAGLFTAAEVGASHGRKRLFILADANGVGLSHRKFALDPAEAGLDAQRDAAAGRKDDVAHADGDGRNGRSISDRDGERTTPERTQRQGQEAVLRSEASGRGGVSKKRRNETVAHGVDQGLEGYSRDVDGAGRGSERPGGPVATGGLSGREYPALRGLPQHLWEPPRVVGNSTISRCKGRKNTGADRGNEAEHKSRGFQFDGAGGRETESPLGRDAHGYPYGVDLPRLSGLGDKELAEIYDWMECGTNRTDELRMCGNGVVPAVASRAWRTLYQQLRG